MLSRGELKGHIWGLLGKSARNPGAYTSKKLDQAVQEAMDFVALEMFIGGQGWQNKLWEPTIEAGCLSIDLPPNISMIKEVYYKTGNIWYPLEYWDREKQMQYADNSSARQDGATYRILDNALYFNPALTDGGKVLRVEHMSYPKYLIDDAEFIEAHFDRGMQHFIKYKAASILASTVEKMAISWSAQETMWYNKVQTTITKRNLQSVTITEFEG